MTEAISPSNDRLIRLMKQAYHTTSRVSKERGVNLRTAALMGGIERIKEAKRRRGVFP